jgi:hypothetical protein
VRQEWKGMQSCHEDEDGGQADEHRPAARVG